MSTYHYYETRHYFVTSKCSYQKTTKIFSTAVKSSLIVICSPYGNELIIKYVKLHSLEH